MKANDLRRKKSDVESKIRELLLDFSNTTGLIVTDVRFEMQDRAIRKLYVDPEFDCTTVIINAKLADD